jgi:predicted phage baseplate assembly protein
LVERNVTFAESLPENLLTFPASEALTQNPRKALPVVRVDQNGDTWLPQRDLLDSDRTMQHFVVEMENDGRATLRFGNGEFGKQMELNPNDDPLHNSYRVGNGLAGNVGAEAIAHILTNEAGIDVIRNPLMAQDGSPPESLEEVRQYAPQAFRTQERAVTEEDYAVMCQRHKEIQKAQATHRWTGSWHTMFVTADRIGGHLVDLDFEDELSDHLDRYRLAGHDVEIDPPRFVPLDIAFTVCVKAGYFKDDVKAALLETFSSVTNPDGRKGFFHPDNFTFGQPLFLSKMIAAAMQVTGVEWVDFDDEPPKTNRFKRWGEASRGEVDDGMITVHRLEIIRLDNDPNQPENGKLEFFMEGGL